MEVDPSLSQFRQKINYQSHDYNDRSQGNTQKRASNSGRYTGPKLQRVNHLSEEHESMDEPTYDEDAEQAVDEIESDELNFLGEGPSCLGFRGQ